MVLGVINLRAGASVTISTGTRSFDLLQCRCCCCCCSWVKIWQLGSAIESLQAQSKLSPSPTQFKWNPTFSIEIENSPTGCSIGWVGLTLTGSGHPHYVLVQFSKDKEILYIPYFCLYISRISEVQTQIQPEFLSFKPESDPKLSDPIQILLLDGSGHKS